MTSITSSIIRWGIDSFVPFSEKISFLKNPDEQVISKRAERARISVGIAMSKNLKGKNTDNVEPSRAIKATKMAQKGKQRLLTLKVEKEQASVYRQAKLGPVLDLLIPGVGAATTFITTAKNIHVISTCAQDSSWKNPVTLKKAAVLGASLAGGFLVAPYLTTPVIAQAVGVAVIGSLTADGMRGTLPFINATIKA